MKIPVHRIIPFSNVEGIGNRTSIFVQGCNINCLYCHNSETIPKSYEEAQFYTTESLTHIIQNNMPFIRGITVSGGEPTLYHHALTELFTQVHRLGITCYIDTNGFFNRTQLSDLIEQTDKFLFDIKAMDHGLDQLCFSNFQLDENIDPHYSERFSQHQEHLENLNYLLTRDKIEEVRHVYAKGFYDEKEVIRTIAQILKPYPNIPFKLIRVHNRGLPIERMKKLKGAIPKPAELEALANYAKEQGINKIITIL
jgi:pyruvate-formate lyase-activating enzyme